MQEYDLSNYLGYRTNFTIHNIKFIQRDSSTKKFNSINSLLEIERPGTSIYVNADILGIDQINMNEPWENRWINLIVVESNMSGKGYRIINHLDFQIDLNLIDMGVSEIEFKTKLIDDAFQIEPLQGSFENSPFSPNYNYNNTYLSLQIVASKVRITSIDILEQILSNPYNIIYNSKIPFWQVMKDE